MDAEPTLQNTEQSISQSINQSSAFAIGQLVDGKYEILSLLGRGGMGTVYRVRHKLLNVDLALKTLDNAHLDDGQSSRRFQTEAKAAFSLKHSSLVKVHAFGVLDNGYPFLVMDLVQGRTLQTLIKERGQLSFPEIEAIFTQLCFGLAYAHQQQVVHRDIKPANIMLVDGMVLGDEGSVKILDFGIAKIVDANRGEMEALTQTGEIFGSPYYMSPEQCSGAAIDQRSDIYSLGCVLFEAITGTPPLVGTNALRTMMLHVNEQPPSLKEAALGTSFPPVFEQIVAKMLAKSPADRYSNLGVVAQEIQNACAGRSHTSSSLDNQSQSIAIPDAVSTNTFTLSLLQMLALIVATISVSCAATLLISHYQRDQGYSENQLTAKTQITPEPNFNPLGAIAVTPLSAQKVARAEIMKAKDAFDKCSEISASALFVDGVKKLKIGFPEYACGVVIYNNPDSSELNKTEKYKAVGDVIVPANVELNFRATEESHNEAFANSFIFDKIDPELFDGLYFEGILGRIELLAKKSSDSKAEQSPGVIHLFKSASKWKKLQYLSLRKTEITKDLWEAVNGLPHLTYLWLQENEFDPRELAHQPFLERLSRFEVMNGEVSEPLKSLSRSKKITHISLGQDAVCSPQSLQSLMSASGLRTFFYNRRTMDDATVDAIAHLKQVRQLQLMRGVLTASQKAKLSKYWTLDPRRLEPGAQIYDLYERGR